MPRSARAKFWRRAFVVTGLIVALGALVGWFALPVQYEAFAVLKVSATEPSMYAARSPDLHEFKLFKATQGQLVSSQVVLNAVLRDARISNLPAVRRHQDDPVAWLQQDLQVSFPDDAEIMRIGLATDFPEDAKTIVDKVVEKYLSEIVEADKRNRIAGEAKLQAAFEAQSMDYQFAIDELYKLEQMRNTNGSEAVQLKKRLALDALQGELESRRKLVEQLQETELEAALNEARAALPTETRTADVPTASTEKAVAEATADSSAGLPPSLLEKKRDFLVQKLAEADKRIDEQTQGIVGLEAFSAQVTAKQEAVDAKRQSKNDLALQLERLKIDRLATERVGRIADAALVSEHGDYGRRNAVFGALGAGGLALAALGMMIGRSRT